MATAKYPNEVVTWVDKRNNVDNINADDTNQLYAEMKAVEDDLKDNVKAQLTEIANYDNLFQTSDFTAYRATNVVVNDYGQLIMKSTFQQWVLLNNAINEICFTHIDGTIILLGGSGTTVVGINLATKILYRFTDATFTNIANLSFTFPSAGDEIYVQNNDDSVIFKIRKVGQTEFSDYFTIIKSSYPTVTEWITNKCFGFTVNTSGYTYIVATKIYNPVHISSQNLIVRNKKFQDFQRVMNLQLPWKDKVWDAFGDSLTAYMSYVSHTFAKLGVAGYRNYGLGGYTIYNIYSKINSISTMPDIVTVFGGYNDWNNANPLGTKGDTTHGTFYGDLYLLMELLKTKYTSSMVAIITVNKGATENNSISVSRKQYNDAIIDMAGDYGYPVLDLYRKSGINAGNITTYTIDGVHYNDVGGKKVGNMIGAFLNTLA